MNASPMSPVLSLFYFLKEEKEHICHLLIETFQCQFLRINLFAMERM